MKSDLQNICDVRTFLETQLEQKHNFSTLFNIMMHRINSSLCALSFCMCKSTVFRKQKYFRVK